MKKLTAVLLMLLMLAVGLGASYVIFGTDVVTKDRDNDAITQTTNTTGTTTTDDAAAKSQHSYTSSVGKFTMTLPTGDEVFVKNSSEGLPVETVTIMNKLDEEYVSAGDVFTTTDFGKPATLELMAETYPLASIKNLDAVTVDGVKASHYLTSGLTAQHEYRFVKGNIGYTLTVDGSPDTQDELTAFLLSHFVFTK